MKLLFGFVLLLLLTTEGWAQTQSISGTSGFPAGSGLFRFVPQAAPASGNFNGAGIRYVTVSTRTQQQQEIARQFFGSGGISFNGNPGAALNGNALARSAVGLARNQAAPQRLAPAPTRR
ncbi:MAG: hypothetical protein HY674_15260 [Chloroflexi bacterium]|nr:hypothetical protein [Chloroflexota bacterium]